MPRIRQLASHLPAKRRIFSPFYGRVITLLPFPHSASPTVTFFDSFSPKPVRNGQEQTKPENRRRHPLQGASSNIPRLQPEASSQTAFFERILQPRPDDPDAGPIILLFAHGPGQAETPAQPFAGKALRRWIASTGWKPASLLPG